MKTLARLSFAITVALSLAMFTPATAQNRGSKKGDAQHQNAAEFQKKLHEQKVEFLTKQLELTEAEASKFWPVYNEYDKQRGKALHKQMVAFKNLSRAIKQKSGTADVEALTKAYTEAQAECRALEAGFVSTFSAILSPEKVAKLIIGEEFYRREQFRRLHQGGQHQGSKGQGRGARGPRNGGGVADPHMQD